jgi:hypothetical protein
MVFKKINGYDYSISIEGYIRNDKTNRLSIGYISSNGYRMFSVSMNKKKKELYIHRILFECFKGDLVKGMVIDHIDNNRLNNDINNLQQITIRLNSSKDIKNKTSKYTGVCYEASRNKWVSKIYINGLDIKLGRFDSELEASNAYNKKLKSIK